MTKEDMIAFEAEVAEAFNAGRIKAPVHLAKGNELELISYFKHYFNPGDWVCSAWRSHYHALLVGVPPEHVMAAILAGRSITLCWPEHRFVTSAIVGGILPIAAGIALGEKRAGAGRHVHCFVGDMTAMGGAFHEVQRYARGHQLPLSLVIEDNGKSVGTPTLEAWGADEPGRWPYVERHVYDNPWPHAGAGVWIRF